MKLFLGTRGKSLDTTDDEFADILRVLGPESITGFDTAREYNNGRSERRLISKLGISRFSFEIITKAFFNPASPENKGTLRADYLVRSVETSLEQLQLARVHVLIIHCDDPSVSVENLCNTLRILYHIGRFEKLGFSRWSAARLTEFLAIWDIKCEIIIYTIINLVTPIDGQSLRLARQYGINLYAHTVFAKGLIFKSPQQILDDKSLELNYRNFYKDKEADFLKVKDKYKNDAEKISATIQYLSSIKEVKAMIVEFSNFAQAKLFKREWDIECK
jgi:aryl-alcohol dehydrogenase-like predicted oxidoreductase